MSDILIDSAFDSGNIEVLSVSGATARLRIPKDNQSDFYQWFHFRVAGAGGRELELNKALTTLGRPGIQVAAITRRQDGYFIVHVDADKPDNFPLVNGMSIGPQARVLNDNDVIQLAGVKMGFFLN